MLPDGRIPLPLAFALLYGFSSAMLGTIGAVRCEGIHALLVLYVYDPPHIYIYIYIISHSLASFCP